MLGRSTVYGLAVFLIGTGFHSFFTHFFAIAYGAKLLLGPMLFFLGMLSCEIIKLPARMKSGNTGSVGGVGSLLFMGAAQALFFCPVAVAFCFGMVMTVKINNLGLFSAGVLFGVGTAFPVIALTIIDKLRIVNYMSYPANSIFSKYFRILCGIILMASGVYYSINRIFL